jgi:hypothetical protein
MEQVLVHADEARSHGKLSTARDLGIVCSPVEELVEVGKITDGGDLRPLDDNDLVLFS